MKIFKKKESLFLKCKSLEIETSIVINNSNLVNTSKIMSDIYFCYYKWPL